MLLWIVLGFVAVFRLTRLVTTDLIMHRFRAWCERRSLWLGYLAECPYCASIWLSGPVIAPIVLWPDNRAVQIVIVALAASTFTGLLAGIEERAASRDHDNDDA